MAKEKIQTYELNIYQLNNQFSLEEFKQKFKEKKGQGIHCNLVEEDDFSVLYYTYMNKTNNSEIDWFKKWKIFFNEINTPLRRESQSGHGVILIHLKDEDKIYAIVFGRSFTLIKDFIVSQFGMDMASILFDGKSIDSISSKYFSLNKNKSITSYYGNGTFEFADNEAVDLLKANIVDYKNDNSSAFENLLSIIKRMVTIGMDNVKLTISKKEIALDDIINVCKYLSEISTKYVPRFPFPKMTPVNTQLSKILDEQLLSDIINNNTTNFEIAVPFYSKSISDEFEFLNNVGEIKIKIGKKESPIINSIDSHQVFEFLKLNNEDITNIRNVRILIDEDSDYLIKWIDAQTDYQNKTYALYDGKWFEFNQSYIDNITSRVKSFEKEVIEVDNDGRYSSSQHDLENYMLQNSEDVKSNFGEGTPYREYIYNFKLAKEKNYKLFDRITFEGNIEVCDLYGDNSLIHCKIGNTANLEECLRQSIYGTKYYFQKQDEVKEKENKIGEKIGDVNTSCVIYLSNSQNIDGFLVSNKKSLRVKQTFIDWYNMCKQMKFNSKLIVSKYTKQDKKTD